MSEGERQQFIARQELIALLAECKQAFDAIPLAAKSRKMLKTMHEIPGAYAGNGSHILAQKMSEKIARFLANE